MNKIPMGQSVGCAVNKYIGSDFDHVINVSENMEHVETVSENITDVKTVSTNIDDIKHVADNLDNYQIDEVIVLGTNQQDVIFKKIWVPMSRFSIAGSMVDGTDLFEGEDYTVVNPTTIKLLRTYPKGTILKGLQAIYDTEEPNIIIDDGSAFNRKIQPLVDGESFTTYEEDGRTLTPRLYVNKKQYVPTFDLSNGITFTNGIATDNGDGTVTVSTTTGNKIFSCIDAEAVARDELDKTKFDIIDEVQLQRWRDTGDVRGWYTGGDCTDAFNECAEFCRVNNKTLTAHGTFNATGEIVFNCAVNAPECNIVYPENYNKVALTVGTELSRLSAVTLHLPSVYKNKTSLDWEGNSVGIRLINIYESNIYIKGAENFVNGVECTGEGGNGFVYNKIFISAVVNNKTNLKLSQGLSGWCNENNFFGGRLSYLSTEAEKTKGTRHIYLENNPNNVLGAPNNNRFYGLSVEGSKQEITIDVGETCGYNMFYGLRYEGINHKIILNGDRNVFLYGYGLSVVNIVDNGERNDVYCDEFIQFNGSSTDATVTVKNQSSDNYPAYSVRNINNSSVIKLYGNGTIATRSEGDVYNRVEILPNGIMLGQGKANPDYYIRDWGSYTKIFKPTLFDKKPIAVWDGKLSSTKPVLNGSINNTITLKNLITILSDIGFFTDNTTN